MSRIDELRAELASAEAEEGALNELRRARGEYLAAPNAETKTAYRDAAQAVNELRRTQRTSRGQGVTISPEPVAASATSLTPGTGA